MASCHTHAALPGGAAVSAATTRAIVHQHCNPPTEFTEFTEASGVEEPPTDFTDAHRWLGCVGFSHGIHGTHRNFWRRRASHGFHRCTQMVRLRRVLPRNSRNSQKLLVEKSLPRMRTDAHRWLGCVGFSHGIHRTHRSFYQGVQQSLLHQPSTRAPTL